MILLGGLLLSCKLSGERSNLQFACSDGVCPTGYECVAELCVSAEEDAAPVFDASNIDAASPDADPPDASPPDAGFVGGCDIIFGTADGYQLCSDSQTTCSFAVTTNGQTCNQICASFMSTCVAAYDNAGPCEVLGQDTCDTPRTTEICECSRP